MTTTLQATPQKQRNIFQPNLSNIPPNVSTELLIYGQSKPNIISLAQGDGSLPTPSFICDAAHGAMQEGKTHYGPVLGQPALRKELSDYYKNIFATDIEEDRIFVTNSGTTSIHLALKSIVARGDEVVCVTPIWRNIRGIIGLAGGKDVQIPLEYSDEKDWYLDMDKLFAACNENTKAILIVSPSNPTGWIMKEEDMRAVLDFARSRGIWIVADEVYNRLAYGQKKTTSFLEISEPDDLLYSVNSFSKSWAMTGWRLGWLVGPKISSPIIQNIALYETMGAPTFNQYGGIAALEQGEDFIQQQMTLWQSNLDLLEERFAKNDKIVFSRPQSTFYAFFKVLGGDDCVDLCRRLIDEVGVSVAPGGSFGEGFESWIRMCFAVSQEELIEAIDRIERLVK